MKHRKAVTITGNIVAAGSATSGQHALLENPKTCTSEYQDLSLLPVISIRISEVAVHFIYVKYFLLFHCHLFTLKRGTMIINRVKGNEALVTNWI